MDITWIGVGLAAIVILLILLLARMVANSKRREIRRKLGLPEGSRLSPEQAAAFQAFENTDMKLRKSFPTMTDTQREAMAREVLRDKGMLPKQKKKVAPTDARPGAKPASTDMRSGAKSKQR